MQFGPPLSIVHNGEGKNHNSALQHTEVVSQYLDKEREIGAILGPVRDADKSLINCSLLLTGGHGGRVVTLSPPTSEAGVRSPERP